MPIRYISTTVCDICRPAEDRELPLVVHVPYASRDIPPEFRAQVAASDVELHERFPAITDDLLDRVLAIMPHLGATVVANRISRLVLDPLCSQAQSGSGTVDGEDATDDVLRRHAGPLRRPDRVSEPENLVEVYRDTLRAAVQEAVDRDGFCVLVEARTWTSDPPHEKIMEENDLRVRVITHPSLTPSWLLAPWRVEELSSYLEWHDPEAAEPGALTASLRERFGDKLSFVRLEVDRHSYLDLEDGFCLHRWSPGPDFVRFLMARLADHLDERCHCRRREMTRQEAQDYACQHRLGHGSLRPVAEVRTWNELCDKPLVPGLMVSELRDSWVVRYGRDRSRALAPSMVYLFDRITGEPRFLAVQFDLP